MGRHGYLEGEPCDAAEELRHWGYRAAVGRAIAGKRGQQLLRDLAEAMDAMPEKKLIAEDLVSHGEFCALGVVAKARGLDPESIDNEDHDAIGKLLNIAPSMAREIAFENDDSYLARHDETPEQRWQRMRHWVDLQLKESEADDA